MAMILSARQHIAAPLGFVEARAATLDWLPDAARVRGIGICAVTERRWSLSYRHGEQVWPMALLRDSDTAPDGALRYRIELRPMAALLRIALTPGGAEATEAALRIELRPIGLQGRLLLGPLRLAPGRVQARLERELAALAAGAEALWQRERG
ncbi:MAG: hypothetical protein ACXIUV_07410 [Alkalilacustris sp.]